LVLEIGAAEFESVVDRRGPDGEGDFFAGMERNAGERSRIGESVLFLHGLV
jgi:hypothetical protein